MLLFWRQSPPPSITDSLTHLLDSDHLFISLFDALPAILCITCPHRMTRIKQESASPLSALGSHRAATPPPLHSTAVSASTAEDIASFLVSTDQSEAANDKHALPPPQPEHVAAEQTISGAASWAVADEDDGECEQIPEEDQLDPDDPTVTLLPICAERLARIRQHWAQQLHSMVVKREAEAVAAQQVLAAYDDLYDEADRGADDSDGSEDGHQEWCEGTDWGGADPSDESDNVQCDSDGDGWEEAVGHEEEARAKADLQLYRRWKTGDQHHGAGIDEDEQVNGGDDDDSERQESGADSDEETKVKRQRESRQHSNQHHRACDRPPHRLQLALLSASVDISDILSEGPETSSSGRGVGYVWQVCEDGSEGWIYDRAREEQWIRDELSGGCGNDPILSELRPVQSVEQVSGEHAAVQDDCEAEMQEQGDDQEPSEEVEQEQEQSPTQSRRTRRQPSRSSRKQTSRKRRRAADCVEQRRTVRRQTSTVRRTRTTTTETTTHRWRERKDDTHNDSDDSSAVATPIRSKSETAVSRRKRKAAKPTADTNDEAEDMETTGAIELDVGIASSTGTEHRPIGKLVCVECGEPASDAIDGSFCSSLCEQWVEHKRFLSDMHRSMCISWRQQHDEYYQPMHNLPLYPVSTAELTGCQLPFVLLASASLNCSSRVVSGYLDHQLALHPAIRLGPSPIHGTGVFARSRIVPNSRVSTIFGLLYPRDRLLDDNDRLLPAARGMDRLLDIDALNEEDVTLLLSISRACVAGYINSVRGTGRRRNVRFECDERVNKQRWGEGWVPSGLMIVTAVRAIEAGEELLEKYPVG